MNYLPVTKRTSWFFIGCCLILFFVLSEQAKAGLLIRGGGATITISENSKLDVNCGTINLQNGGVLNLNGGTIANKARFLIDTGDFNNVGGTIENCLPTLDKQYLNSGIFPEQATRVFYVLRNQTDTLATGLAFSDTLDSQIPSGLTITNTTSIFNGCGGDFTALDGSSTLSLSNVSLVAGGVCVVAADIEGNLEGVYDAQTSELSSNLGSGNATRATLSVLSEQARVPIYTTQFSPNTIRAGQNTVLSYTINNTRGVFLQNINFVNQLPSSIRIASDPNISTDCIAQVGSDVFTAPANGSQIEVDNYAIPAGSSCTFSVNVTSTELGANFNTVTSLISDAGDSGSSNSLLTVTAALPDVSASRVSFDGAFFPSIVDLGERSTLTFTIDNTEAGATNILSLLLDGALPQGLEVANPNNASSNCGFNPVITANVGGSTFSVSTIGFDFEGFRALDANQVCSVSLDVIASESGSFDTSDVLLTLDDVATDFTTAALEVNPSTLLLGISKTFSSGLAFPGEQITASYVLENNSETISNNVTFSDDFSDIAPGVIFMAATENTCGGNVISLGSTGFELNSASITNMSSCRLSVVFVLPLTAATGVFESITTPIIGEFLTEPFTGNSAAEALAISTAPQLTSGFTPSMLLSGDDITLQYTLTNPSSSLTATDISFDTVLPLQFSSAEVLPNNGDCGASSTFSFIPFSTSPPALQVRSASLGATESCTFSVTFETAEDINGSVEAVTSALTALVGGQEQSGQTSVAQLEVVGGLMLSADFVEESIQPGANATLNFALRYSQEAVDDVTGIAFSYDADALINGAVIQAPTVLPSSCGINSVIGLEVGDSLLSLQNIELTPGQVCEFQVDVAIPLSAADGLVENESSAVSALINGEAVAFASTETELLVSSLVFTSRFIQEQALPGELVTLEYSIENFGINDASNILFTQSITDFNLGLFVTAPLPTTPCGFGSTVVGTTTLALTAGTLNAGSSCVFQVDVLVSGSNEGSFTGATSELMATIDGSNVVSLPAFNRLLITRDQLLVSHSFDADSVVPGDTAVIEYEITNLNALETLTGINFLHDLTPIAGGLELSGLPQTDVCGVGSSLINTAGAISLSGGQILAEGTCTFSVSFDIPEDAELGIFESEIVNVSATTLGGLNVTAEESQDLLLVRPDSEIEFSKSFSPSSIGGESQLIYTISNNSDDDVSALRFTDDLQQVISGLVSTESAQSGVCGLTSQIDGVSELVFTGGALEAGASCSFSVNVMVPLSATSGEFVSQSSELFSNAIFVSDAAQASLLLSVPQPVLSLDVIVDGPVFVNETVRVEFTINTIVAVTDLAFSSTLPVGLEVANPEVVNDTCAGALTAVAGSSSISYSGGVLGNGGLCTVSLDVTATSSGEFTLITNTLNSSLGVSNSAQDTFTVISDIDGDGIADTNDNCPAIPNPDQANLDNDEFGNVCDLDDDGDGLPDSYELANGLDPLDDSDQLGDLDGDGFNNLQEFEFGTDPNVFDNDVDNNNIPDLIDLQRRLIPTIILPLILE